MTRDIRRWHRFVLGRMTPFKKQKQCRCAPAPAWGLAASLFQLVSRSAISYAPGMCWHSYIWLGSDVSPLTFKWRQLFVYPRTPFREQETGRETHCRIPLSYKHQNWGKTIPSGSHGPGWQDALDLAILLRILHSSLNWPKSLSHLNVVLFSVLASSADFTAWNAVRGRPISDPSESQHIFSIFAQIQF